MPLSAPSQVRVETLIARGRLVLAVFLLLALRVSVPRASSLAFGVALAFLAYAGVLGLLVRTRFSDGPRWPGATHAVDLSVYATCLFLLGGLAPSMLAWFLFLLVSATLRWGWRGTLTTGSVAVALHVAIVAHAAETLPQARMAPAEFITLALLMGVMTLFVGLVGRTKTGAAGNWRAWRRGQVLIPTAPSFSQARCLRRPPWCSKRRARCWCGRKPKSRSRSSRSGPTDTSNASGRRRGPSAKSSTSACETAGFSAATWTHGCR